MCVYASAMNNADSTEAMLKASGLKATAQRIAVYDALRSLGHASADAVVAALDGSAADVSVATVYNVLDSFVDAGLISRRFSSNSKMYYDITTAPHCHLYDEDTHTIVDYDDSGLVGIVESYIRDHSPEGFEFSGVDIQIVGHKTTGQ